jgi:hypothetical protein
MRRWARWTVLGVIVALCGCGSSSSSTTAQDAQITTAPTSQTQPSPVSTAATLTSTCTTGIYDQDNNEFYSMSDTDTGNTISAGDTVAEAYQITLTNNSANTASVGGFAAVFYSEGLELTSDNETFGGPSFITPGQSLSWTEYPWGTYTAGENEASQGPYAAGQMGAVNTAATCSLVQWYKSP